jgi:hypothetical protein
VSDIEQGDLAETEVNVEQQDVNEVRPSINQIDFIGVDVTEL